MYCAHGDPLQIHFRQYYANCPLALGFFQKLVDRRTILGLKFSTCICVEHYCGKIYESESIYEVLLYTTTSVVKNLKGKALLSFTLLILVCFSGTGQSLFPFASLGSANTIATYGTIINGEDEKSFVKTIIIFYGVQWPDVPKGWIEHMARFDMVDTGFELQEGCAQIHALNPDTIVLGYKDLVKTSEGAYDWNIINANEDWFLHDLNGNRLRESGTGSYLLDISNQGYREHYADDVIQKMDQYGHDGVFADDCWSNLWRDMWTVPVELVPDWNYKVGDGKYTYWQTQMREFLSYIKSQMGKDKILIYNGPWDGYLDVTDGQMLENFVFNLYSRYPTEIAYVDKLSEVSATGKYVLAVPYGRAPDTEQGFLFSFCCYLLGVNGPNAYFGYKRIWDSMMGYHPHMVEAERLGLPTGDYYSYQSVYARDYENGTVLVNTSSSTYTVDLQGTYETPGGEVVTEITMAGKSGAILMKR